MAPEYHFDYHAARPNRFAKQQDGSPTVVVLDEDVARIFTTPEAVNKALPRPDRCHACYNKTRSHSQGEMTSFCGGILLLDDFTNLWL